jgi:phenylalanyl-tRNA synthetase beta chain
MKFSKQWLQTYSKETLKDTETLKELITLNAFEIEEVTEYEGDDILDIKVLPNRAHDALSHRGMARDVTALCNTTFVDPEMYYEGEGDAAVTPPHIVIEDTKACTRFMSVRIDGVTVTESPEWLKKRLLSIGQKSINSIVDITNYVQFAINKPMHAYDAGLIEDATLIARFAYSGESLVTLDDKELSLNEKTLVIADTKKPLGLAGIKGGKYSGISSATTSVILESANFNPVLIRKTSQAYGIRTDASKRFENELSDSLVEEGLRMTITLIKKLNEGAIISSIVDIRGREEQERTIKITLAEINRYLGTSYQRGNVVSVFEALNFLYTEEDGVFVVVPPLNRLDIVAKEDIIEEIVRINGLNSVPSVLPDLKRKGVPHKRLAYENIVRNILFAHDFSDIMTYSFGNQGEVRIKKGLASDKEVLRSSLSGGVMHAFSLNMQNGPLLKTNLIKLYEFGNVFTKEGERRELAILIDDGKKKSSYETDVVAIVSNIKDALQVDSIPFVVASAKPYCVVIDFDALINDLEEKTEYIPLTSHTLTSSYQPVSPYPFIVRDVAVFVPTGITFADIMNAINGELSSLVISCDMFDTFQKTFEDGTQKTSYAFRMVLQSSERTLTDEEANALADKVYAALKEKGWEVR